MPIHVTEDTTGLVALGIAALKASTPEIALRMLEAQARIVDGAAGRRSSYDERPAHCRLAIVTGHAFPARRASEFSQDGFYLGPDYDPFADEARPA